MNTGARSMHEDLAERLRPIRVTTPRPVPAWRKATLSAELPAGTVLRSVQVHLFAELVDVQQLADRQVRIRVANQSGIARELGATIELAWAGRIDAESDE